MGTVHAPRAAASGAVRELPRRRRRDRRRQLARAVPAAPRRAGSRRDRSRARAPRGHGVARDGALAAELLAAPEGARRARHDRRPRAQRPRARLRSRSAHVDAAGGLESHPPCTIWCRAWPARLRDDVGLAALLRATSSRAARSPAQPKVRAMEIIRRAGGGARAAPYTGALRVSSPAAGDLELALAIRTAVVRAATAYVRYHAGGGIVADSDPEARAGRGLAQDRGAPAGARRGHGARSSSARLAERRASCPRARRASRRSTAASSTATASTTRGAPTTARRSRSPPISAA